MLSDVTTLVHADIARDQKVHEFQQYDDGFFRLQRGVLMM